jgi:hypothetical protein
MTAAENRSGNPDYSLVGLSSAGAVEQQEAKELKRHLRGVLLVEATLSNGRLWAMSQSGRSFRHGTATISGCMRPCDP